MYRNSTLTNVFFLSNPNTTFYIFKQSARASHTRTQCNFCNLLLKSTTLFFVIFCMFLYTKAQDFGRKGWAYARTSFYWLCSCRVSPRASDDHLCVCVVCSYAWHLHVVQNMSLWHLHVCSERTVIGSYLVFTLEKMAACEVKVQRLGVGQGMGGLL